MKHILCIHLPHWPIDRLNRRRAVESTREGVQESDEATKEQQSQIANRKSQIPQVLIQTTASRQIIACVSPEALAAGIWPGMPLADARALCPQLRHHPYEPARDLRALQGLARWMIRFSPIAGIQVISTDPVEYLPAIFLDITGSERLYGGWINLLEQVADAMDWLHLHARLAIAPSPGAAYAIASCSSRNGLVVGPDELVSTLSPLPVTSLRIAPETIESLHHLGLVTIGHLLAIPRDQFSSRFGSQLLLRLGQAMGHLSEPIVPLAPSAPIGSRIDFDGVVDAMETITRAIETLVDRICTDLAHRGRGARRLILGFHRLHAPAIHREVLLSRPSRQPGNLLNLLRCAVDMLELDAQKQLARRLRKTQSRLAHLSAGQTIEDEGFSAISLDVPLAEPVIEEQFSFDNQAEAVSGIESARLIERLVLRLGESAVVRAELVESHLPERAFTFHAVTCAPPEHAVPEEAMNLRPLLLTVPREIQVLVAPSQEREGRPVSFTLDGDFHRIIHAIGPERIAGLWWEGHHKTRDYFAVEDEQAGRWWLFRVRQTHRWFMHGEFA